jgi:hypothetical protein
MSRTIPFPLARVNLLNQGVPRLGKEIHEHFFPTLRVTPAIKVNDRSAVDPPARA